MLGKEWTHFFPVVFFVVAVTTVVGWVPSEASLGVFSLKGCLVVSAEPPLTSCLWLFSRELLSSRANRPKGSAATGHTRWKGDEDGAKKRWYRKKIGGDIAMGTAACAVAVLWKGAGHLTAGLYRVSTLLCLWSNAGKTHGVTTDRKPLAVTVRRSLQQLYISDLKLLFLLFISFFYFVRHQLTAEYSRGDWSQPVWKYPFHYPQDEFCSPPPHPERLLSKNDDRDW